MISFFDGAVLTYQWARTKELPGGLTDRKPTSWIDDEALIKSRSILFVCDNYLEWTMTGDLMN
jgi:hypothetical protein